MRLLTLFFSIMVCAGLFSQDDDEFLIQELKVHKGAVKSLAYSPSGKLIASGSADKILAIHSTDNFDLQHIHKNMHYEVKDLVFFGNTQLFIASGNDIRLIDMLNNNQALFEGNTTHLWSIDFATERNKIVGGSYDTKIKVWDVSEQNIDLVLEGHEKSTLPVCFSPDEKYIVSGSRDESVKVWNAKTGALMKSLERHSGNIYDVQFHTDGKYFASASGDKTVRVWNIESGDVVKTYTGHDASILDVEFSPDGYFMYTASFDGVVIIYHVATGKKLYSYVEHVGGVNAVEPSPDGMQVATAGDDGKVYVWKSAKLIAVELGYGSELKAKMQANPIFEGKRKGESKEAFQQRQVKADEVKNEIVNQLFQKYIKDNGISNTFE